MTGQSEEEAELKLKECQCWMKINDSEGENQRDNATQHAIAALECVPEHFRTLAMNLTLGGLYMRIGTGSKSNAIHVYKQAIRQNPMALEV